jgi:hypothetical protein
MKEEDLDDLNGRICITQFFGVSIWSTWSFNIKHQMN